MEKKMVIATCRYAHPVLGVVHVKVHGSAKSIRASWKGQELQIIVPPNLEVKIFDDYLAEFQDRILSLKPVPRLYVGQIIDTDFARFSFEFGDIPAATTQILLKKDEAEKGNYVILVGMGTTGDDAVAAAQLDDLLNRTLTKAAIHATAKFVVPQAKALAETVERRPLGWDVKAMSGKLGMCSSRGIITLSPRLVFLPEHLRKFIIFHELAHLSEMNHSSAFHALCNQYCGGCEASLNAELKSFSFPIR